MKLVLEQAAFLLDVCKLINFATEKGFVVTGGELARPMEMQQLYKASGKARTLLSQHLLRLAIDLNFFFEGKLVQSKGPLQVLGDYWESLHPQNRWGGNWKSFVDCPHFERRT